MDRKNPIKDAPAENNARAVFIQGYSAATPSEHSPQRA